MYRLGQLEPELYKEAVDFYRRASDGRSAEASFQLGFMHQFGIGLPRDFHLAKRFYDLAGSSSRQAVLPALLAVISLGIHSLFSGDIVGGLGGLVTSLPLFLVPSTFSLRNRVLR